MDQGTSLLTLLSHDVLVLCFDQTQSISIDRIAKFVLSVAKLGQQRLIFFILFHHLAFEASRHQALQIYIALPFLNTIDLLVWWACAMVSFDVRYFFRSIEASSWATWVEWLSLIRHCFPLHMRGSLLLNQSSKWLTWAFRDVGVAQDLESTRKVCVVLHTVSARSEPNRARFLRRWQIQLLLFHGCCILLQPSWRKFLLRWWASLLWHLLSSVSVSLRSSRLDDGLLGVAIRAHHTCDVVKDFRRHLFPSNFHQLLLLLSAHSLRLYLISQIHSSSLITT